MLIILLYIIYRIIFDLLYSYLKFNSVNRTAALYSSIRCAAIMPLIVWKIYGFNSPIPTGSL